MKTLLFIYLALVLITLSACQPSGKEAIVSGNNICITDPVACNATAPIQGTGYTNQYGNQNNQGYYPYGGGYGYNPTFNYYNNNAYLCNCPNGTVPTYHSGAGLGCVAASYLSSTHVGLSGYFYLSWGQNRWNTMPQLYRYNYGGSSNTCYNGAVQSCALNQADNCPAGSICRPNSTGSNLGLCVASHR
ncbi:MAG: hypothetical protein AABY53_05710 [Bdellovibrionota bacterium]